MRTRKTLLKYKVAKQRKDDEDNGDESRETLRRESEFQKEAWKQLPDKQQEAERKIMEARGADEGTLQCYIRWVESLQPQEEFTDRHAQHILRQAINGQQLALVVGNRVRATDALQDVGISQRRQALEHINIQLTTTQTRPNVQIADDLTELFESIVQIQQRGNHTHDRASHNGSTPPRLNHHSTPKHIRDDYDDDQWVLSVIRGDGGEKGNVGNGENLGGGDGDKDGDNGAYGVQAGDQDIYNNGNELARVNPRNIEVKKFTGESNSKMTHLEFNESKRELAVIKGNDGIVLNMILTWAGQRGDNIISSNMLEQMEKVVPKSWEYDRATHAALMNWVEGEARMIIKYKVGGGIDAWRNLHVAYIHMAQTKQDIILIELLELKQVTEKHVRKLLNRLEE